MTSLPVVAIAGATGRSGKDVTKTFLSPKYRSNFKDIIVLSRSGSSELLESWAKDGAIIRSYSEDNLEDALKGVNIVVNLVGSAGYDFKDVLLKAIAASPSVSLYFPSEFGVDHGDGTDPDFDIPEWNRKKAHIDMAQESFSSNVKICSIYPSLFLELSIGPWFGLDTKAGKYEVVGSADTVVSFTSMADIAKVVASLASMPKEKIPEHIRVAGDSLSFRELAKTMTAAGGGEIEITEIDLEEYKKEAKSAEDQHPAKFLRFLMGSGKLDFSQRGMGNKNELVNPGGKEWTWTTVKDYAQETMGRPWA